MSNLIEIVNYIISEGFRLTQKHISNESLKLDYVAIFTQNLEELNDLTGEVSKLGNVVEQTPSGKTYQLNNPIQTSQGPLYLIKIRNPDISRPQRGEPDFRVANYTEFKRKYGLLPGMKLIERPDYEMLELNDSEFDVLVYFPSKPLGIELGIYPNS